MGTFQKKPVLSKIVARCFALVLGFQALSASSAAGDSWVQINHDGFQSAGNRAVLVLGVFDGHLFAPTYHETRAEVWKIPVGATDPDAWVDVTPPWGVSNTQVLAIANHAGYLFVGTNHCEIWRLGTVGSWVDVTPSDSGWTVGGTCPISLASFQGAFYAARGAPLTIWRMRPDGTWEIVVDDAFGDSANNFQAHLAVFSSRLYAATGVERPGAPVDGTEVWRTANGTAWEQVNADGFGDSGNAIAPAAAVFRGRLYLGTINHFGGQIWRYDGAGWEAVNACEPGPIPNCSPKAQALARSGDRLYAGFGGGTLGILVPGISVLDRTGSDRGWGYSTTAEGFGDSGNLSVESLAGSFPYVFAGTLNNITGAEVWMRQPTAIERLLARLEGNIRLLQQERLRIRSCRQAIPGIAFCYLNSSLLNDIRPFLIETRSMIGQTAGDFPKQQALFTEANADLGRSIALLDRAGSLLKQITPNLSRQRQRQLIAQIDFLLNRDRHLNLGVFHDLRPLAVLEEGPAEMNAR